MRARSAAFLIASSVCLFVPQADWRLPTGGRSGPQIQSDRPLFFSRSTDWPPRRKALAGSLRLLRVFRAVGGRRAEPEFALVRLSLAPACSCFCLAVWGAAASSPIWGHGMGYGHGVVGVVGVILIVVCVREFIGRLWPHSPGSRTPFSRCALTKARFRRCARHRITSCKFPARGRGLTIECGFRPPQTHSWALRQRCAFP